nr:hypothetical protein [uncultured Arsenicibacter sp.]
MSTETTEDTKPAEASVVTNPKPVLFETTDAVIERYRADYMGLVINGPDDRQGAEIVHAARMIVKNARVALDKARKKLVEDSVAYQRLVNGEANRIKALLEPIERHLDQQEGDYDYQREQIRIQKQLAEQKRIEERVTRLRSLDFTYDQRGEVFTQYKAMPLTWEDVQKLPEDQFNQFIALAAEPYNAEQERLAELERKRAQEAERVAEIQRQQEAEQERLQAERLELERQQAELVRQQQEVRFTGRVNVLLGLGFIGFVESSDIDGFLYEGSRSRVFTSELKTMDDAGFDRFQALHQQELVRLAEAERKRQADILAAEERARVAEQNRIKAEQEAEAERQRKEKAREERRLRLMPDRQKLAGVSSGLTSFVQTLPAMKTDEGKAAIAEISSHIARLVKWIDQKAETL